MRGRPAVKVEFLQKGTLSEKNPSDIYREKILENVNTWKFINDPFSEKFMLLEETGVMYRLKYRVSINYYKDLLEINKELVDRINNYVKDN